MGAYNDLFTLLRSRLLSEDSYSTLGFYDRSMRSWKQLTQVELLNKAAAFSKTLHALGVHSGQTVLLVVSSPQTTLQAFLAAQLIGAVPAIVPIRTAFDSNDVLTQRIADTLQLVGTQAAVVVEHKNGKPIVPTIEGVNAIALDINQHQPIVSLNELPHSIRSTDISHIQLTSGSTGAGKGVAITHANVMANIEALRLRAEITPYDTYVTWLPLYHDMGLISQALMTLVLGIDVYFMSPFDFLADPGLWMRTMSEMQGTVTASPAFAYDLVSKKMSAEEVAKLDLSRWKSAYCGAEPIDSVVAKRFYETFAPAGLSPKVFTPSYGLAEATLAVTAIRTDELWREVTVSRSSLAKLGQLEHGLEVKDPVNVIALGEPVEGLTVELVDENGNVVENEFECGEIVVKGSSVAAGWVTEGGAISPFKDGWKDGWLHTGDIGFFEQGELFVVDRIKNIIIRNGHNYSAQVLEQAIAEALNIAMDNVIVLDRDIVAGAGLTAVIEVAKHQNTADLLEMLHVNIDHFEPPLESVAFVKQGSLPRTTSGKKRHIAVREALNSNELKALIAEHSLTHTAAQAATIGTSVPAREAMEMRPVRSISVEKIIDIRDDASLQLNDVTALITLITENVRARKINVTVTADSRLQHDLDFDSLGLLELALKVEEKFEVELDKDVVSSIKTVNDMAVAIHAAQLIKGKATRGDDRGLTKALNRLKEQVPQYFTVVDEVRPNREIHVEGRWMTDFGSCGYLGMEERPEMLEAIVGMHNKWGLQHWASRAIGMPQPLLDLEKRIAEMMRVPEVMAFASVTLLHSGVLPILGGSDGALIIDSAAHTSIQEAALLARSHGTTVAPFKHGDLAELENQLQLLQNKSRRIILLDGIYSMSGAALDVRTYQLLAEKYDAYLYIDDAHGFGVIGENPTVEVPWGFVGNGTVHNQQCSFDRIFYVGSFGKAFSTALGFITYPSSETDRTDRISIAPRMGTDVPVVAGTEYRAMFNAATPTIFGHQPAMSSLAQANAALNINEEMGDQLRRRLFTLATRLADGAEALGFVVRSRDSGVINIIAGDIEPLILATNVLWEDGIKITPAMFPAVPLNEGGLRFTVTASNTEAQVDKALASLSRLQIHV